jgi:hypothetical protein
MQEVTAADRELHAVDPADALELALVIATHRMSSIQERYGVQLDSGDLALLSVEGETIDRVTRVAQVTLDEHLDERRARAARRQTDAFLAVFERVCAAVPDLPDEARQRMLDVAVEDLGRLENTPPAALDAGELFPTRKGRANA